MNKITTIILIIALIGITSIHAIIYTTNIYDDTKIYFYDYQNEKKVGEKVKNLVTSDFLKIYDKLYKNKYQQSANDSYSGYILSWYSENVGGIGKEILYILSGNLTMINMIKQAKEIKDDVITKGYINKNIYDFNKLYYSQYIAGRENIREYINNSRTTYSDYKSYINIEEFTQEEIVTNAYKYDRCIYYYDKDNQKYYVYPAVIFVARNNIKPTTITQYIKNGIEYVIIHIKPNDFVECNMYTQQPNIEMLIKRKGYKENVLDCANWYYAKYEEEIYDVIEKTIVSQNVSYEEEIIENIYHGDSEIVEITNYFE